MNPTDSAIKQAALTAYREVLGVEPAIKPWMEGSGPIHTLSDSLGIPVICAGTTWHEDTRAHAPNENIYIKDYFDHMRLLAGLIAAFAQ
jgi:acetylornithine deacetylase/succinyl-diaminopimelate desuccinylase-like protein